MNVNDLEELVRTTGFVNGFKKRSYAQFSSSGFVEGLVKIANKNGVLLVDMGEIYGTRKDFLLKN